MDKTYLTAGTMIHRLCEASSANCMTDPSMRRTLAVFEEKLGTNCRTTTDEKKQEVLLGFRVEPGIYACFLIIFFILARIKHGFDRI